MKKLGKLGTLAFGAMTLFQTGCMEPIDNGLDKLRGDLIQKCLDNDADVHTIADKTEPLIVRASDEYDSMLKARKLSKKTFLSGSVGSYDIRKADRDRIQSRILAEFTCE